ncbi:lipopolysaccharide-induced tumor necrosis factor-alpha factor homolog [Chanos chanos]|uniref:Lipopolysaccharide-induced tumor necrosis factor-alpha factor homolog n=1 Tax=Chanos chanos TaxID=29144 RepID=A0A6J2VS69_CHACN|nr:lipopolysaccharide-induced tumor necrosis factor-alpha factor homolog [Chanos chanos]
MDIPECAIPAVRPTSPPPSYSESNQFPVFTTGVDIPSTPPPVYSPGLSPPPYGEAVSIQNESAQNSHANAYPVLNIPTHATVFHQTQQTVTQQTVQTSSPQVVVMQQEVLPPLGDTPTATVCRYCHHRVTTQVTYKAGSAAWGMCCLLTLLGLICGFCLIPFLVKGFKDVHHSCPNCHKHLGIYVRK